MKLNKGFSLIELLVAVAIIGILASIALPAYQDYVTRSKIPDATGGLANKRIQMEQWLQDNKTYTGADAAGGPCANDTTTSKYFTFSCVITTTSSPGDGYVITATGGNADQSMAGFTYTIDQNNAKATAAAPSGWPTNTTCWVTSKGGSC